MTIATNTTTTNTYYRYQVHYHQKQKQCNFISPNEEKPFKIPNVHEGDIFDLCSWFCLSNDKQRKTGERILSPWHSRICLLRQDDPLGRPTCQLQMLEHLLGMLGIYTTCCSYSEQCPHCQLGIALNRARSDQSQIVCFVI